MSKKSILFLFGSLMLLGVNLNCFAHSSEKRDVGFGYPDNDDIPVKSQNEKQPLYLPSRCKVGELFYPGDQLDDWVCDCKPGHIYFPPSNRCFSAHTRGPCAVHQHLILLPNTILPICTNTFCPRENEVFFRGKCHRLNSAGPCDLPELGVKVSVDAKSLQLDCLPKLSLGDRIGEQNNTASSTSPPEPVEPSLYDLYYYEDICFVGGKRSFEGKCRDARPQRAP